MTATLTAASPAIRRAGAAPAGLNEPQTLAAKRLETARAVIAQLAPLDPEWLRAEAYYEQLKEDH